MSSGVKLLLHLYNIGAYLCSVDLYMHLRSVCALNDPYLEIDYIIDGMCFVQLDGQSRKDAYAI